MVTIACVLRSEKWLNRGRPVEYLPEHVHWLKRQVDCMVTRPHRFVCLSNLEVEGIEVIPLVHNWPGWWAKIELFRPGLFPGNVFYLDLDTVIIDNINHMIKPKYFTALKNLSGHRYIGSGVMAWRGDYSFIYDEFRKDAEGNMAKYSTPAKWGDQSFITDILNQYKVRRQYWQVLFPGSIMSSKPELGGGAPKADTKIVCFHGLPKPFDMEADWIPGNGNGQDLP